MKRTGNKRLTLYEKTGWRVIGCKRAEVFRKGLIITTPLYALYIPRGKAELSTSRMKNIVCFKILKRDRYKGDVKEKLEGRVV